MLPQLLSTAALLSGASLAAAAPRQPRDSQRPIFTIGHKVMEASEIKHAIRDEASAIEIDLTAWREGDKGEGDDPADVNRWWIDHDGDGIEYGDPADEMLEAIGNEGEGKLSFIILDIKTPDYCEVDEEGCGMEALVNMVRDSVLSKGIGAVYGITKPEDADTPAFKYIVENLDDDAAVRITGKTGPVLEAYEAHGGDIPKGKRIIDYGNPNLGKGNPSFGKCERVEDSGDVCPNLVHAVEERDNGNLGAVFMWTVGSSDADGDKVQVALDARIDGIVYGYADAAYEDHERMAEARGYAVGWVDNHDDIGTIAPIEARPYH